MTKASGGEILYVDDRPENIETGKSRGWNAVLHTSPAETIPQVQSAFLTR
jgi:FMN phosphatase YigB (HAD superfamily)